MRLRRVADRLGAGVRAMPRPLAALLLLLLLSAAPLAGCDGSGGGGGGGADCSEPTSQGLSQPCCLAHGVDACGATLFCAAFDGRTQPTCYPERSRLTGESCFEDRHCASGSCHLEAGVCRGIPFADCDPEIGCARDPSGNRYACVADRCEPVGDGALGAVCESSDDCEAPFTCGPDHTCMLEGACGEVTGEGVCIEAPDGDDCYACRATNAFSCFDSCRAEFDAVGACGHANGCIDGSTANPRCVATKCADALCDLEACAAEACPWQPSCY
jgi:hypothetical protein